MRLDLGPVRSGYVTPTFGAELEPLHPELSRPVEPGGPLPLVRNTVSSPSARGTMVRVYCHGDSSGWINRWPLMPKILSSSSFRKPFITAMTMMRVATPSMMPRNENPALTEMKPSFRRARR